MDWQCSIVMTVSVRYIPLALTPMQMPKTTKKIPINKEHFNEYNLQ